MVWGHLNFILQTGDGSTFMSAESGWNLTVFDLYDRVVATFDLNSTAPTWTAGGGSDVTTQDRIVLTSPHATPLSGYTFVADDGVDPCAGSVTVAIP